MAVRTRCAACHQTGGSFILRGTKWYHKNRCTAPSTMRDQAKSTFPFTTQHLSDPNDGPVTVQSLAHLRRIETSQGVCSEAYSMDSSNRGEGY